VCQYLQTKNGELETMLSKTKNWEEDNEALREQIRKRNDELSNEREIANDLRDRLESING
jgi:predicted nuclease with TOPRIM domain